MKCVKCETKMDRGIFTDSTRWHKGGKLVDMFYNVGSFIGSETCVAYRCPKCGYIESYSTAIHKKEE